MKVYVRPNNIVLVGKAWEIRHQLKEYNKEFDTVLQWITFLQKQK
ncbi:Z-ring formation inhibitor MciZ [Sutcliffiella cohnii]|nr:MULTISPECIES: Z-ring formation inhibitor MciZ [Sutcliffiella]MED4017205.1 Z-ring formation inhibitor MciZ [Sutcliffiella cohnii]WBL13564.1 Z-ring formation inhibitor MciZ [Sutcliffiella sp. NC1]